MTMGSETHNTFPNFPLLPYWILLIFTGSEALLRSISRRGFNPRLEAYRSPWLTTLIDRLQEDHEKRSRYASRAKAPDNLGEYRTHRQYRLILLGLGLLLRFLEPFSGCLTRPWTRWLL